MKSDDCNHWAELSDRLAVEEELSLEERRFISAHRGACGFCAAEAELLEGMKSCLEENSATLFLGNVAESHPRGVNRLRWLGIVGTSLAAAAVLLLVLGGARDSSTSGEEHGARTSTQESKPALENRGVMDLLMVAGAVAISGGERGASTSLDQGDHVETKQGRVCLSPDGGATLCLENESELSVLTSIEMWTESTASVPDAIPGQAATGVALTRGTLSVRQPRVQQPSTEQQALNTAPFVVQTKWAKIRGFGATFVVGYMDSGEAFLRLHEGRVEVQLKSGRRNVGEGRRAFTIDEAWQEISPKEERFEEDRARFESMPALPNAESSAVEIQSDPSSSVVTLDGRVVGATPVSMMLAPGEHHLEIFRDGYAKLERTFTVEGTDLGTQTFVLAPASARGSQDPPTMKSEGPRGLLLRAQTLRSKGDFAGASLAYEQLIRSHPDSGEGRAALVSLGELSLSQLGAPQKALSSFERYLRDGGPLSQEASYGQIRALRALGREDEARTWGRKFVAKYPDSAQAVSLRRWL